MLLVRGVDACKEVELHIISNYLLEKGLSTLAIDCAGQGEARFQGLKMTPDFEASVGVALDYLDGRPDIDTNQVGILGQSFGAYIVARAASLEKRLKACVCMGGFYSLEDMDPPRIPRLNMQNAMQIGDGEWLGNRKHYNLDAVIEKMTCPLVVVNGSEDEVLPVSQSLKLYEKARCPKDLKIYDGAQHCVYYERKQVLSYVADWISAKLQ